MAQGDGTIGFGGVLEINDGAGSAFVLVDAIVTLGVASYTLNTVDSKRLSSDVVKVIPGIKKGDAFTIQMENTRAGVVRFRTLFDAREEKQFRFTIPDDEGDYDEWTVPGIVTQVKKSDLEVESITMLEVSVQVSDDPV